VFDEFEDDDDGDLVLNPGRPGKKRSKNKKHRYVPHQYNFDDEDF